MVPLSTARYKLELTLTEATRDKLRRAQELLRHAVPDGDVEQILARALDLLIEKTEKRRFGAPPKLIEPPVMRDSLCSESGIAPTTAEAPPLEPPATNERAAEAPPAPPIAEFKPTARLTPGQAKA